MMLIIFLTLSALTIVSCISAILSKLPIYSLLSVIVAFFSIAGHYLLLQSQFLAAVQVIVYAGAILVLFLFTIMFMNLNYVIPSKKPVYFIVLAVIACAGILAFLLQAIHCSDFGTYSSQSNIGEIKNLGKILLNKYFFPFEFISVLLLTAMIGSVLISKKR